MKNIHIIRLFLTAAFLLACHSLGATVASPKPFKYTQPDGTVITLQKHGDEFYSWTTCGEAVVAQDASGFYRPSSMPSYAAAQAMRVERMRNVIPPSRSISTGNRRFMVILIEFADLEFTVGGSSSGSRLKFDDLLNKVGYSENGGTGSAYDYFYGNSCGQFNPSFDVYGPVKLSQGYSHYGENSGGSDAHPYEALYEALQLLDDSVDFSQYDNDGDGYVDGVFFFYAGHNEAEGGPADTIWPHKWSLWYYSNPMFDGVRVSTYACTSEYSGSSGTRMCGIGTFCHEFGHSIGLPDVYDTDYYTNGMSFNVDVYSAWGSGNYNNDGRTPPALSAFEKELLGWGEIPVWTTSGQKTLQPVFGNDVSSSSGKILTKVDNEYFYCESRGGCVWDSYLPTTGVLVYHVDRSSNIVSGTSTAASLWENNKINAFAHHPCYHLEPAATTYSDYYPYPGAGGVTAFNDAVEWSGVHTGAYLAEISHNAATGVSGLSFEIDNERKVMGTALDQNGLPLADVRIAVVSASAAGASSAFAPSPDGTPRVLSMDLAMTSADYRAVTASDGSYCITLTDSGTEYFLYAAKDGYYTRQYSFTLEKGRYVQDIILYETGTEANPYALRKYADTGRTNGVGFRNTPCSIAGAVKFSASELATHVGDRLSRLSFAVGGTSAEEVYLLVDYNTERVVWQKLDLNDVVFGGETVVDIEPLSLEIPANTDIYLGYAVVNSDYGYPLSIDGGDYVSGGCMYSGTIGPDAVPWKELGDGNLLIKAIVKPYDPSGNEPDFPEENILGKAGFSFIAANPSYAAGTEYVFTLVKSPVNEPTSVAWFYDGAPCSTESVLLQSGVHVIEARLSFKDGHSEKLRQEIEVVD